MGDNLQFSNIELEQVAIPDYWQEVLGDSARNASENSRRGLYFEERVQRLEEERQRREAWERRQRIEHVEEGYRRDKFLAFLVLDDYREQHHRGQWLANNAPPQDLRPTLPAPPPPPPPGTPQGQRLVVDVVMAQEYARQQRNEMLNYDAPRPVTCTDCHLCDAKSMDQWQLDRHIRRRHPANRTDLFQCEKCKLSFYRRDSAINHHKRFHSKKALVPKEEDMV